MRRGLIAMFIVTLGTTTAWAHPPITSQITWNREIVRIFRASCMSCHQTGSEAFSLIEYDEARAWARSIREEVLERRMPPWPAALGVGEFANDPSLPPRVVALIVAWVDGGTPRGDAADLPTEVGPATSPTPSPRALRWLEVTGQATVERSAQIIAVVPHARRGDSIEVRIMTADGARDELVYIPRFDQVRTYWLKRPLYVERGAKAVIAGGRGATLWVREDRPRSLQPPRR
jgi:hypothetical protein